jgi:TIR domain
MPVGAAALGHVFVSYSTADRALAEKLLRNLEAKGVRIWMAPRDIQPGSDYSEAIADALDRSTAVVALVSDSANLSRHVKAEIEIAFSRGKPLFPVRFRDIAPTKGLSLFLGLGHWTDLFGSDEASNLDRLAAALLAPEKGGAITPVPARPQPPAPRSSPPRAGSKILWATIGFSLLVISTVIVLAVLRTPAPSGRGATPVAVRTQMADTGIPSPPAQPARIATPSNPNGQAPDADALAVVTQFYAALSEGDGATAASLVVPEKRRSGFLSAAALTQFYGSLAAPLEIAEIAMGPDGRVRARYHYWISQSRACDGTSFVRVITSSDGTPLIAGIEAPGGC